MRWRLYFDDIFSSVIDFVSVPLIFSFKLSKAAINSSFEGIICTNLRVLERILQVPCAIQQKIFRYPFSNTMCKEQQMKNFLTLYKRSANIPIISCRNIIILIINNVSWYFQKPYCGKCLIKFIFFITGCRLRIGTCDW